MSKIKGLRIVKKNKLHFNYELNFKSQFDNSDKKIIKEYVKFILQTEYKEKCINVSKHSNGLILLIGNRNYLINEIYMSEIRILL